MDKENLRKKLSDLIQEGKKYNFHSFPTYVGGRKFGSGAEQLIESTIPEWDAWTQRVRNTVYNSFKNGSAPYLLVKKGLKFSQFYKGTNKDTFQKNKKNFEKGLELALKAADDDSHNELIEKIENTKNQPKKTLDAFPTKIYNTFNAPVTGIQQGGQNNTQSNNTVLSLGSSQSEDFSAKNTFWAKLQRISRVLKKMCKRQE